jgi:ATP-dependent Lhr-like helicase
VQVELAISRLVYQRQNEGTGPANRKSSICIWGISATIGNLNEARDVLLKPLSHLSNNKSVETGDSLLPTPDSIISANIAKKIEIESIFPDEIEKYPWAGHLGIKLAKKIIPIIELSSLLIPGV